MELVVKELPYHNPVLLFANLPADKYVVFFDSASSLSEQTRFSFIAYDPFAIISCSNGIVVKDGKIIEQPPLVALAHQLRLYSLPCVNDIPFMGGLAGHFGYESVNYIEPKISLLKQNDRGLPDFIFGVFDLVVVFDHFKNNAGFFPVVILKPILISVRYALKLTVSKCVL